VDEQEKQEVYNHKLEFFQAMAKLDSKQRRINLSQGHVKEYLWSVLIPPIGLFYFIKHIFFSDGEEENIKAGIISLLLTLMSLFLSFWLIAILFKQTAFKTSSQNTQILKEFTVPDNQKKLLQLFK